ncbi:MAG: MFS transporter [Candidatus Omnitrophica bacterium]|nr:MFS transporter [Candidatus Omnitrophota bacterium]
MSLTKERLERTLKISYWKGVFGSAMAGFTQEFFTPFILFMGGHTFHIGILNGASNLMTSFVQLFSADLTERCGSRKKMTALFVLLQSFALAVIVMMIIMGIKFVWPFLITIIIFSGFGAVFIPAWSSFLSDLVDVAKRGEYFGWRSRNLGLNTLGIMFVSGIILDQMKGINTAAGFGIIFGMAMICRFFSFWFLQKMEEPPIVVKDEDKFTFLEFFARFKESNFVKFVIFIALMNFSVNLAAPFFSVFMLEEMHFSYATYTLVNLSAPLGVFLSIRRWGLHADKVGNLKIIRLTTRVIAIMPLFWLINRNPTYLFFVEMLSGFLWAGLNLCVSNFVFDAATPQKRPRCIAYLNVVNGLALALGALIGGVIVKILPKLMGYQMLSLFLVASVCRIMVAYGLLRMVQEVRPVQSANSLAIFFSMIRLRPILGIDRRSIQQE